MLNSRPAIVVYVESPSRPAAIAVPKYRPDWAAAAPNVLAAASAVGMRTTAPAAASRPVAAASTTRYRLDLFKRFMNTPSSPRARTDDPRHPLHPRPPAARCGRHRRGGGA